MESDCWSSTDWERINGSRVARARPARAHNGWEADKRMGRHGMGTYNGSQVGLPHRFRRLTAEGSGSILGP